MCICQVCVMLCLIFKANPKGGVGVAVVIAYIMSNGGKKLAIMLGLERWGPYGGQYNLCSGKKDQPDECFVTAALRELYEEFQIKMNREDFLRTCTDTLGNLKIVMVGGTPIFVLKVVSVSRSTINHQINKNIAQRRPSCFCEMQRVDWFELCNKVMIPEGSNLQNRVPISNYQISSYAQAAINKINSNINYYV